MLLLFIIVVESLPALAKFFMSSFGKANPYDFLLALQEMDVVEERESEIGFRREARKSAGSLTVDAARIGHDLERKATEKVTQQVVDAQIELAEMIVNEWKVRERQRVAHNLDDFLREDDARGVPLNG